MFPRDACDIFPVSCNTLVYLLTGWLSGGRPLGGRCIVTHHVPQQAGNYSCLVAAGAAVALSAVLGRHACAWLREQLRLCRSVLRRRTSRLRLLVARACACVGPSAPVALTKSTAVPTQACRRDGCGKPTTRMSSCCCRSATLSAYHTSTATRSLSKGARPLQRCGTDRRRHGFLRERAGQAEQAAGPPRSPGKPRR